MDWGDPWKHRGFARRLQAAVPHAETDCMAGHVGLEPADPCASYLFGFT
jgi:hypothetical protein